MGTVLASVQLVGLGRLVGHISTDLLGCDLGVTRVALEPAACDTKEGTCQLCARNMVSSCLLESSTISRN